MKFIAFYFVTMLVVTYSVLCQSVLDTHTPLSLQQGVGGKFDNINLYNGQLGYAIPLVRIGGRGTVNSTINLQIQQRWLRYSPPGNVILPDAVFSKTPIYNVGKLYSRQIAGSTNPSYPQEISCPVAVSEGVVIYEHFHTHTLQRLTFTDANGVEHTFVDVSSDGSIRQTPSGCAPMGTPNNKAIN